MYEKPEAEQKESSSNYCFTMVPRAVVRQNLNRLWWQANPFRKALPENTGLAISYIQKRNFFGQNLLLGTRKSFETPPDKKPSSGYDWKIASCTVFERLPVILPELDPVEELYEDLIFNLWNRDAIPYDPDVMKEENVTKETRKGEQKRAQLFTPAPRITEADEKNIQTSLDRKLDETLYFVVRKSADSKVYQFPQRLTEPPERMRTSAEKALKAVLGNADIRTYFIGNAPFAHLEQVYPADYQRSTKAHGVKVFFYKAQIITGEVKSLYQGHDFLWLTRNELQERIPTNYYAALKDCLW